MNSGWIDVVETPVEIVTEICHYSFDRKQLTWGEVSRRLGSALSGSKLTASETMS